MNWLAFLSGAALVAVIAFVWMCVLDWRDMKRMERDNENL